MPLFLTLVQFSLPIVPTIEYYGLIFASAPYICLILPISSFADHALPLASDRSTGYLPAKTITGLLLLLLLLLLPEFHAFYSSCPCSHSGSWSTSCSFLLLLLLLLHSNWGNIIVLTKTQPISQLFQRFFPITDIATHRLNQSRGQII